MYRKTYKRLKEIYDRFYHSAKPVRRAHIESIHALVNLAEARDPYTKSHSLKVSNYAVLLSKRLKLPKRDINNIKLAAVLHDIGKIGIKQKILLKNSSLNGEEYEEVKKHAAIGVEIIKPFKFFNEVIVLIKHHHENYDGTGYPDGLKREDIPLGSKILAITDVYDALTSKRAYRDAYSPKEAIDIMKKESGKKFDPKILDAFIACLAARRKWKNK